MSLSENRKYCVYCGRVAHRCQCSDSENKIHRFFERSLAQTFTAQWRPKPYKRGVPPQIKKKQRALMRKHYATWYAELCTEYGEQCSNCGAVDELVIDHVLPVAKGGQSEYANVQLLCRTCNNLKGKLCIDCRRF